MARVSTRYVKKGKKYQRAGRYKARAPWTKTRKYGAMMPKLNPRRAIFGFPSELTTKIRYTENLIMTSTSSSISKYVFRMNSIFDPDFTSTGHQPLYHDQLAALYTQYTVLGSKLTVQFAQLPSPIANAQPSGPVTVGVIAESTGTTDSLLTTLEENNFSKSKSLLPAGNGDVWLTSTYSPELLGLDAEDDTIGASFGANPSNGWFCTVFVCETNGSTAVSVNAKVQIEYTVRCKKLIDISGS